jgi:hypothetical protein
MAARLQPTNSDVVWEPCAGAGDLIDGVLQFAPHATIRASEVSSDAVGILRKKYTQDSIEVRNEDALEVGTDPLNEPRVSFTRIIANPPYGAYQSPDRRRRLQTLFAKLYVRETYGVILFDALSLLRPSGRLVFIVPDTFLWLTRHEFLRRTLVTQTTIEELALFPSRFFPGIDFGYSGLCILTLSRLTPAADHAILIATNFTSANALMDGLALPESASTCSLIRAHQSDIAARPRCELVTQNQGAGIALSKRAAETLGNHAAVKTGFY